MKRRPPPKGYKYNIVYDPDGGVYVQLRKRRARLGVFSTPVDAMWLAYKYDDVDLAALTHTLNALERRNGLA